MGTQKIKTWAIFVINRRRQKAVFLFNRKPVSEMKKAELKAHNEAADPEIVARRTRREARRDRVNA